MTISNNSVEAARTRSVTSQSLFSDIWFVIHVIVFVSVVRQTYQTCVKFHSIRIYNVPSLVLYNSI